jgi:hypothetical protein
MWELGGWKPGFHGCEYASDPSPDAPWAGRFAVKFDFFDAMPIEDLRAEIQSGVDDGRCLVADVSAVHPDAMLERCVDADATKWMLRVPDSQGRGIWTVSFFIGDNWQGTAGPEALPAVADLATRTRW